MSCMYVNRPAYPPSALHLSPARLARLAPRNGAVESQQTRERDAWARRVRRHVGRRELGHDHGAGLEPAAGMGCPGSPQRAAAPRPRGWRGTRPVRPPSDVGGCMHARYGEGDA